MSGLSMPEQGHAEAASDDKTAEKPGVHPPAEQNAQTEAEHAAIVQIPPATHMVPSLPKKAAGQIAQQLLCYETFYAAGWDSESAAQICLAHLVGLCQLCTGAGQGDGAGFQHIGTVGDLKRLAGVLLHQQNGGARPV